MTLKGNDDPEIAVAAIADIPLVAAEVAATAPAQQTTFAVVAPSAPAPQTTLAVVAPTTMVGGYEFFADAGDGQSYRVRVPPNGAQQGEQFHAIIVETTSAQQPTKAGEGGHNVPIGKWRDGVCDCHNDCCQPSCCLGMWCRSILLGQVLTRNKLDWFANPIPTVNFASFKTWMAITLVFVVTSSISVIVQGAFYPSVDERVNYVQFVYDNPGTSIGPPSPPGWAQTTVNLLSIISTVLSILMFIATCRARIHLRERYNIPTQECGGCEDCCCAWFCAPCTICQMARHTANYEHHPSTCCTATGLRPDAPEVV